MIYKIDTHIIISKAIAFDPTLSLKAKGLHYVISAMTTDPSLSTEKLLLKINEECSAEDNIDSDEMFFILNELVAVGEISLLSD